MYLILGLGKSGKSACRFLQQRHLPYKCVDRSNQEPGVISDQQTPCLEGVSTVIKSPGIRIDHPWILEALRQEIPICSEIDLALPFLKHKTLIGITGSNGKTTTVTALGQVLGSQARCVGNIGVPLIDVLDAPEPILVIELSSFQLETIQQGPWFEVGCLLNLTPNHLDVHGTMEKYEAAKMRLADCIRPGGLFLTEKDYSIFEEKIETIFQARYRDDKHRLYAHDRRNFAAVYAICQKLAIDPKCFAEQIVQVKKPPHRLEFVCQIQGVNVINDSKSTSVDATLKAVATMSTPVLLIAGGVDKGGAYSDWLATFKSKVRKLYAVGQAARRMEEELGEHISLVRVATLEEAVERAMNEAQKGETLLLSPGCSSYDQFLNFEQRGEKFKQLVEAYKSR